MEDIQAFFESATRNDNNGLQSQTAEPSFSPEVESPGWSRVPDKDLYDTRFRYFPLEELYEELLANVFETLQSMSRQSALALAAVSHNFYRIGFPILHQSVDIDPLYSGSQRFFSRVKASKIPGFIRYARISGAYWGSQRCGLGKLAELISRMHNLENLRWMGSYKIPTTILRAIETLPSRPRLILDPSMLNPRCSSWDDEDYMAGRPEGLDDFTSPRLDTLILYHKYIYINQREPYQEFISRILRSCQNLRVVKGSLTPSRDDKPVIPIYLGPGRRLPPVQEISYMPIVIRDNASGEWANLKTLKVESIDDLAPFEGSAPYLESLTIRSIRYADLTTQRGWGLRLGPLRKIELVGQRSTDLPLQFLRCYGETLEELVIQSTDPEDVPRKGIRPAQLYSLAKSCPNIHTLSINLNPGWVWQGSWPVKFLQGIRSFSALEILTLIASCHQAAHKPKRLVIDEQSVCGLHELLQSTKQGCQLRSLRVEHTEFLWNRAYLEWEIELQVTYVSILSSDGQSCVSRLNSTTDISESELQWKMAKGEYTHPYERDTRLYPLKRYTKDADLIWLAQNLGVSHSLTELVPDGLLSRKDIMVPTQHEPAYNARSILERHHNSEIDGRVILKRELQVRKWVREHGTVFLYDILYSLEQN